MRALIALFVVGNLFEATYACANDAIGDAEGAMVSKVIPISTTLSASIGHLESKIFPGKWGRVSLVVINEKNVTLEHVHSRDWKRIRELRDSGQRVYEATVKRDAVAWHITEQEVLERLKKLEADRFGSFLALIDAGTDTRDLRWHRLKVLHYDQGIGVVQDDDGKEKGINLIADSSRGERELYGNHYGPEKRARFEQLLAMGAEVHVFTSDRAEGFDWVSVLLIDGKLSEREVGQP